MPSYGDEAVIAQMLGPSQPSVGFDTEMEGRITAMNGVVSTLIEEKTGRAWSGIAPSQSVKTIYPRGGWSDVLILPIPATSISAITVGADDQGGVVSGGSPLAPGLWSVSLRNEIGEITAIRTSTGVDWISYRVVQITGVWANTQNAVPDDIEWVANYVSAERIKQEQANPAGFVGPDGTVQPIRDPWSDAQVKAVLKRWTLTGKGIVL